MLKHNIDTEYDSWLLEQAQLLRDRDFQHLDIDNLVEEIEALVRGEKSSVEQFAYLIMLHLLLIEYWYEQSEWNRNQRCDPSEVQGNRTHFFKIRNKSIKYFKTIAIDA